VSPRFNSRTPVPPAGKFLAGVFGLIFAGIGITVIVFLWGAPRNDFFAPPLFFRVFGTFIALAFVAFGGTMVVAALTSSNGAAKMWQNASDRLEDAAERPDDVQQDATSTVYACSQCGAPLAKGTEISPHGDVKCGYCNCWFNVRGK
jgi:DNA-directed RNA polymerase subunit RPC12/RpoP